MSKAKAFSDKISVLVLRKLQLEEEIHMASKKRPVFQFGEHGMFCVTNSGWLEFVKSDDDRRFCSTPELVADLRKWLDATFSEEKKVDFDADRQAQ